jgi:OmpA-OmpF porin, OOP family
MNTRTALVTAAAGLALSGCTSFSAIHDVDAIRAAEPKGGTAFTRALAMEYRAQADEEVEEVEWGDAQWFARKGLQAARGEAVLPATVAAAAKGAALRGAPLGPVVHLPPERVGELTAAHARLTAFLDKGGRDRQPIIAAHAQAVFDCWVEEEWEGEPPKEIGCRTDFLQTEKRFTPVVATAQPATMRRTFQVFFDWDRSDIGDSSAEVIRHVSADAHQGGASHIDLVGHTDSSGSNAYNQKLSERRADAVKGEFIRNGMEAGRITSQGVGEAGQLVPTADGVREPQNRRTEIIVK